MGDGAADCASKGESAVEGETRKLLGLNGSDVLDGSIELGQVSD